MPPVNGDDGTPSGYTPSNPYGVWGDSGSSGPFGGGGNGVIGSSASYSGVAGVTLANSDGASGVYGRGPQVGVAGEVEGASGFPSGKIGVYGNGAGGRFGDGMGVLGVSESADGVMGSTDGGVGVSGISANNIGVFGMSNGIGILGWGGYAAGYFLGPVHVAGNLSKSGGGFQIDHPLDPAKKYLRHSFVESPEMKNLYDGIAVCNAKGEAEVRLPAWFGALNRDYCYQLTPLGAAAPNLFVASQVKNNRFRIGGGRKGLKVCWQVTGVRQDAWANANRLVPEEKKSGAERGRYLHPELHRKSAELGIAYVHSARAQELLSKRKMKKK
ncbi:MAG TPA: hypothetical protein VLV49_10190 [Terriglobales bacterium]|nr:hypothetical protein [Terriglobales bacterium]